MQMQPLKKVLVELLKDIEKIEKEQLLTLRKMGFEARKQIALVTIIAYDCDTAHILLTHFNSELDEKIRMLMTEMIAFANKDDEPGEVSILTEAQEALKKYTNTKL